MKTFGNEKYSSCIINIFFLSDIKGCRKEVKQPKTYENKLIDLVIYTRKDRDKKIFDFILMFSCPILNLQRCNNYYLRASSFCLYSISSSCASVDSCWLITFKLSLFILNLYIKVQKYLQITIKVYLLYLEVLLIYI